MKTASLHGYHGIVHRDQDSYGWAIQIRLNGRYRLLRTYASDAKTAARRHDVALNRLLAFVDITARPNFPAEYPQPLLEPDKAPEDYNKFRADLNDLFQSLCNELESVGKDYDETLDSRLDLIQESQRREVREDNSKRLQLSAALDRVEVRAARLTSLSDKERERVKNLFGQLKSLFNERTGM